jgi:type IV secretory pathway VirB4 component
MAVYEEYQPRRRWQPAHVSDVVPWRAVVAPGVVLQKYRHGLQRTYAVRGPDVMGETPEVQGALMLQANDVLKRLGGRWMLQSEAQRRRVTALPEVAWRHPVPALIEQEQRHRLLVQPGSRETAYFLTLTWYPPAPSMRRGLRWLMRGPGAYRGAGDTEVSLRQFVEQADYLMDLLKGMLAVCRPLTTAETLTYLHNCVSERWHAVARLAALTDIDVQLCDTAFIGGWYPQLGQWHVRTCSVMAYPAASVVGVVRELDAADVDYRWSTRWVGLERHIQAGMLRKTQGAWVGQERSLMARLAESISHQPTRVLNTDATNKAEDADAARQEIGADIVAYGEFTSTVTVWDTDPERVEDKLHLVMQAIETRGFVATAERQHATAAWLSSHPGNQLDNVRRTPQHSLTLAHLCPGLTAAWPGPERDPYLDGGPWLYAHTEQTTLFRVVNHVRDVGHFLVLGATGSGKSTFGNVLRAQWLQYPRTQAMVFDLDGHARLLTYLLGGTWHDLGSPTLRFQPLRHVDDPLRRGLIVQWLLDLLEEYHVATGAHAQAYLGSNLLKLAQLPPERRTLSRLVTLMAEGSRDTELKANAGRIDAQGISHPDMDLRALVVLQTEIRTVLARFTDKGEYGGIFDATEDAFDDSPIQTFELRALLQRPRLLGPVLRYVLLHIELQMSTEAPMLLLIDDAAIPWAVPKMEEKSREWMMTTRKKSVSLGFMTHSLSQVFGSPLGVLLEEGCPTRFFLPMPAALEPNITEIFTRLGLTHNAIRLIATARPQRDVYYACTELGQRRFSLPLGPLTLACVARNSAADHALMERLLAQEGRGGFAAAWLRAQGFSKEAEYVAHAFGTRTRGDQAAEPGAVGYALAGEPHAPAGEAAAGG